MSKRLPSLTALRTFEAAARHLSFALAADELSVTPAAVGFQIKQLEEELGSTLFLRKHRAVELTDKGQTLLADLGSVFKTIQSAWDAAHEPVQTKVLRVSGPVKAVHNWIMPALSAPKAKRSDIRISWDLSKQNRDIANGEVDMAIRWALQPDDTLHCEPVLRTWFTPLLRPDIARFVDHPRDLEKHGLIDVEFKLDAGREESTWAAWFRVNGLEHPKIFAINCTDTASAIETAVATGHVAIGGSFLAYDQFSNGALVAPFDTAIVPMSQFWLVCRKGFEKTAEYAWFLGTIKKGATTIDARLQGMKKVFPDGTVMRD